MPRPGHSWTGHQGVGSRLLPAGTAGGGEFVEAERCGLAVGQRVPDLPVRSVLLEALQACGGSRDGLEHLGDVPLLGVHLQPVDAAVEADPAGAGEDEQQPREPHVPALPQRHAAALPGLDGARAHPGREHLRRPVAGVGVQLRPQPLGARGAAADLHERPQPHDCAVRLADAVVQQAVRAHRPVPALGEAVGDLRDEVERTVPVPARPGVGQERQVRAHRRQLVPQRVLERRRIPRQPRRRHLGQLGEGSRDRAPCPVRNQPFARPDCGSTSSATSPSSRSRPRIFSMLRSGACSCRSCSAVAIRNWNKEASTAQAISTSWGIPW